MVSLPKLDLAVLRPSSEADELDLEATPQCEFPNPAFLSLRPASDAPRASRAAGVRAKYTAQLEEWEDQGVPCAAPAPFHNVTAAGDTTTSDTQLFKARTGCLVPEDGDGLLDPPGPRVWTVEHPSTVRIRDARTGQLLETVSNVKPLTHITCARYGRWRAAPTDVAFGSPERAEPDDTLCHGRFVYVGFNDGSVRLLPTSPFDAITAHRSKHGHGADAMVAADLPKAHAGAVTAIATTPSRSVPTGFANAMPLEHRPRQLVCVASVDSVITVWDSSAVCHALVTAQQNQLRLQAAIRSHGNGGPRAAQTSASRGDAPFFARTEVFGAAVDDARDRQKGYALSLPVHPMMRLKGDVVGIRSLAWVHTTVVDELPHDYCWSRRESVAPSANFAAAPAPPPHAFVRAATEATQGDRAARGASPRTATLCGDPDAAVEDAAPPVAKPCREVDLLVSGDDEGRVAIWDLQTELRKCVAPPSDPQRTAGMRTGRGDHTATRSMTTASARFSQCPTSVRHSRAFCATATSHGDFPAPTSAATGSRRVQPRTCEHVIEFGAAPVLTVACEVPPLIELRQVAGGGDDLDDLIDMSVAAATSDELLAATFRRLSIAVVFSDSHIVAMKFHVSPHGADEAWVPRPHTLGLREFHPVGGVFLFSDFEVGFTQCAVGRRFDAATAALHDQQRGLLWVAGNHGSIDVWRLATLTMAAGIPAPAAPAALAPADAAQVLMDKRMQVRLQHLVGHSAAGAAVPHPSVPQHEVRTHATALLPLTEHAFTRVTVVVNDTSTLTTDVTTLVDAPDELWRVLEPFEATLHERLAGAFADREAAAVACRAAASDAVFHRRATAARVRLTSAGAASVADAARAQSAFLGMWRPFVLRCKAERRAQRDLIVWEGRAQLASAAHAAFEVRSEELAVQWECHRAAACEALRGMNERRRRSAVFEHLRTRALLQRRRRWERRALDLCDRRLCAHRFFARWEQVVRRRRRERHEHRMDTSTRQLLTHILDAATNTVTVVQLTTARDAQAHRAHVRRAVRTCGLALLQHQTATAAASRVFTQLHAHQLRNFLHRDKAAKAEAARAIEATCRDVHLAPVLAALRAEEDADAPDIADAKHAEAAAHRAVRDAEELLAFQFKSHEVLLGEHAATRGIGPDTSAAGMAAAAAELRSASDAVVPRLDALDQQEADVADFTDFMAIELEMCRTPYGRAVGIVVRPILKERLFAHNDPFTLMDSEDAAAPPRPEDVERAQRDVLCALEEVRMHAGTTTIEAAEERHRVAIVADTMARLIDVCEPWALQDRARATAMMDADRRRRAHCEGVHLVGRCAIEVEERDAFIALVAASCAPAAAQQLQHALTVLMECEADARHQVERAALASLWDDVGVANGRSLLAATATVADAADDAFHALMHEETRAAVSVLQTMIDAVADDHQAAGDARDAAGADAREQKRRADDDFVAMQMAFAQLSADLDELTRRHDAALAELDADAAADQRAVESASNDVLAAQQVATAADEARTNVAATAQAEAVADTEAAAAARQQEIAASQAEAARVASELGELDHRADERIARGVARVEQHQRLRPLEQRLAVAEDSHAEAVRAQQAAQDVYERLANDTASKQAELDELADTEASPNVKRNRLRFVVKDTAARRDDAFATLQAARQDTAKATSARDEARSRLQRAAEGNATRAAEEAEDAEAAKQDAVLRAELDERAVAATARARIAQQEVDASSSQRRASLAVAELQLASANHEAAAAAERLDAAQRRRDEVSRDVELRGASRDEARARATAEYDVKRATLCARQATLDERRPSVELELARSTDVFTESMMPTDTEQQLATWLEQARATVIAIHDAGIADAAAMAARLRDERDAARAAATSALEERVESARDECLNGLVDAWDALPPSEVPRACDLVALCAEGAQQRLNTLVPAIPRPADPISAEPPEDVAEAVAPPSADDMELPESRYRIPGPSGVWWGDRFADAADERATDAGSPISPDTTRRHLAGFWRACYRLAFAFDALEAAVEVAVDERVRLADADNGEIRPACRAPTATCDTSVEDADTASPPPDGQLQPHSADASAVTPPQERRSAHSTPPPSSWDGMSFAGMSRQATGQFCELLHPHIQLPATAAPGSLEPSFATPSFPMSRMATDFYVSVASARAVGNAVSAPMPFDHDWLFVELVDNADRISELLTRAEFEAADLLELR